jgi:rhodanese-related sulfurtransferase
MSTQSHRRFKDTLYEQFSRIGKAVASPRRLELLDLLCQGERPVESLARETHMSVANTSQHLQALRAARLVDAQKDGQFVVYRLADERVCDFFHALRDLARTRLAEVDRVVGDFLGRRDVLEAVDRKRLLERAREGAVTVLDVRPLEEYRAAHVAGAVSIPVRELERRLSELPRDQDVVAYCRGPYCVFASEAVNVLRANGFRASRLEEGIADLRRIGFEVEAGEPSAHSPKRARPGRRRYARA